MASRESMVVWRHKRCKRARNDLAQVLLQMHGEEPEYENLVRCTEHLDLAIAHLAKSVAKIEDYDRLYNESELEFVEGELAELDANRAGGANETRETLSSRCLLKYEKEELEFKLGRRIPPPGPPRLVDMLDDGKPL